MIPQVAASERGKAQTDEHVKGCVRCAVGVVGSGWSETYIAREVTKRLFSRTLLERRAIEGDSPVDEKHDVFLDRFPK